MVDTLMVKLFVEWFASNKQETLGQFWNSWANNCVIFCWFSIFAWKFWRRTLFMPLVTS